MKNLTYEEAGVSFAANDEMATKIKPLVESTRRSEVLGGFGTFGGLFALSNKYDNPVLVSSVDSVGTKLKVAFMMNKHDTVGYDIVAHCGNDILVLGAEPIFFLDYIGIGKLEPDVVADVVAGLAHGCKDIGCTLIGGETAELSDFYAEGEYDLAGTIVGVVEKEKIITGETIEPGDQLIGLASSGLHTNGFTLARKVVFEVCGYGVNDTIDELKITVGEELLKPHKSYVKTILTLIDRGFDIKGLAHITGGGLRDNLVRILPDGCHAVINKGSYEVLPVFRFLQERGNISEDEMYHVFNMGIGMVVVVPENETEEILSIVKQYDETPYLIGEIKSDKKGVSFYE